MPTASSSPSSSLLYDAAPIAPLPTPPPPPSSTTLDIKVYLTTTHDLVKIRLPRAASLDELKSKVAERAGVNAGLLVAKPGVDTRDPAQVAPADLEELEDDCTWREWFKVAATSGARSGKQSRIVVWAA